jgi:hypothetical protein
MPSHTFGLTARSLLCSASAGERGESGCERVKAWSYETTVNSFSFPCQSRLEKIPWEGEFTLESLVQPEVIFHSPLLAVTIGGRLHAYPRLRDRNSTLSYSVEFMSQAVSFHGMP